MLNLPDLAVVKDKKQTLNSTASFEKNNEQKPDTFGESKARMFDQNLSADSIVN